jgi:hypothetical protein
MIIDVLGLPVITGAGDKADSSMFAGMITLFSFCDIPIEKYCHTDLSTMIYVRHPEETRYDFSRDQAICLVAGFYKKDMKHLVNTKSITGKDFLSPSVRGHILRCQGKEANWFQNLWLRADILFHAKATPISEPNQLICMMMVAGPEYVRLWKRFNPKWEKSVRDYWCGWRCEPELHTKIISTLGLI